MTTLLWDASALVKRYFVEAGSETVNALVEHSLAGNRMATPWGYTETYAVLVRKYNSGLLSLPSFNMAVSSLRREVIQSADFDILTVSDTAIFASVALIQNHNLNSVDAAILATYIRFISAASQQADPSSCILIASDKRLLRAANAEGLQTLNPETIDAGEVEALLAGVA